jgi:hypothetical protein
MYYFVFFHTFHNYLEAYRITAFLHVILHDTLVELYRHKFPVTGVICRNGPFPLS